MHQQSENPDTETTTAKLDPLQALNRIHNILDGTEWEAGTLDLIAEVITRFGFKITDPNDPIECVLHFKTDATLLVRDGTVVSATVVTPSAPGTWTLGDDVEATDPTGRFNLEGRLDQSDLDKIGNQSWPDPIWEG